jgi:hypothetical protein
MEIEIKPDSGGPVAYKLTPETEARRVAPGSSDLGKAQPMQVTDMHLGDRVLATPEAGTKNLRRIVVMTGSDLKRREDADREDWQRRGVSGIVVSKAADSVTLKTRTMTGETQTVVKVDGKTRYRRYAPDSVRFADAKKSSLAEVAVGDQVRARGVKGDGVVNAEELVAGAFTTRAGTIAAVNAAGSEITVKELGTGKPLTIHFTADSQIKRMLSREEMVQMMHGPQAKAPAGGEHGQAAAMQPPMMTLNEMLERLPLVKVSDLAPEVVVIVSSTRGAKADRVTAISALANAEMLLQAMAMQSGAGGGNPAGSLDTLSSMGFGVVQ